MKAFPTTVDNEGYQTDHGGMELRDYFAAKAIINGAFSSSTNAYDSITAKRAYEIADAMMKAREE